MNTPWLLVQWSLYSLEAVVTERAICSTQGLGCGHLLDHGTAFTILKLLQGYYNTA